MISKTVRQNLEFAASISAIKSLNPALARESDVPQFAYHQMATDIIADHNSVDWDKIVKLDFKDSNNDVEFSPTRAVTVDEDDFEIVLEHFRERPMVKTRVKFAYLTRLVLFYTRNKLRNMKEDTTEADGFVKVETTTLDGVELLRQVNCKAADLIKAGDISKIMKFLEEIV